MTSIDLNWILSIAFAVYFLVDIIQIWMKKDD